MITAISANAKRIAMAFVIAGFALSGAGCSMTTLPWPELNIAGDEADEALTKNEQARLEEILSANQKNHRKSAVQEIEGR